MPGKEQAANHLGFEAVLQVAWIEVIVLDGIARAHDMGVFHTANRLHDLDLHVERQGGGNPVRVQLVGGQTFRLDKDLMAFLVGKAMDLVFDRRAITRADTFDHTGIHRRTIKIGRDDFVCPCVGMGNPATDLGRVLFLVAHERHHGNRGIARLLGHDREIHRAAIDTRWCTGFQAADSQRQFTQTVCQGDRRWITGAAARVILHPDVDKSTEEGACCQNHGISHETQAHLGHYATHLILFNDQVISCLLKYPQVGLVFERFAYRRLVQNPVGLCTGCPHSRAFTPIKYTELDAAFIGSHCHRAAKGIDFFNQMAFTNPANCRIAAHLPEGFHVVGQQQGFYAHTC